MKNSLTFKSLVLKSFKHYWKQHLLTVVAIAIATGVIAASFIVGDSVRSSLKSMNSASIGNSNWVISTEERFFESSLGIRFSNEQYPSAAVLALKGLSLQNNSANSIHDISIYGIDDGFKNIYSGFDTSIEAGQVVINQKIADYLNVDIGDQIRLRLKQGSLFLPNSPMVVENSEDVFVSLNVKSIISNNDAGRFSLSISQSVPNVIFLNLDWLGKISSLEAKANTLLVSGEKDDNLYSRLNSVLSLRDLGISFIDLNGYKIASSSRIFFEEDLYDPFIKLGGTATFSYFVNGARTSNSFTPFLFLASVDNPLLDIKLEKNEIAISELYANDSNLSIGEEIEISYFVYSEGRELYEESQKLLISQILSNEAVEKSLPLVSLFPGISEAESCLEWDPTIPIDFELVRDEDEEYWEKHKQTPRLFVSLDTAKEMAGDYYVTSIIVKSDFDKELLLKEIDLKSLGFNFEDIRTKANSAAENSVDFTQLFLGLSFFIIISSIIFIILIVLMFVDKRSDDIATMKAVGFTKGLILKTLVSESFLPTVIGAIIGLGLGTLYTFFIVNGLNTLWSGATNSASISLIVGYKSLLYSFISGVSVSILTIFFSIRRLLFKRVKELTGRNKRVRIKAIYPLIALPLSLSIVIAAKILELPVTYSLMGSSLVLISLSFLFHSLLNIQLRRVSNISWKRLLLRRVIMKKGQSFAILLIVSSSIFMFASISANSSNYSFSSDREGGTGGFDYIASTLTEIYNPSEVLGENYFYSKLMVNSGDDASCLNLNSISTPKIASIDVDVFSEIKPFSFVEAVYDNPEWSMLNFDLGEDVIPAIADATVITWGLGMKVGDELEVVDDEGRIKRLRLVAAIDNSIMQGHLLISEMNYLKLFPSTKGYSLFLINDESKNGDQINRNLRQYGAEVVTSSVRLKEFHEVEATYLEIFAFLGYISLLFGLGSIIVVYFRNREEDKVQIELYNALGLNKKNISKMIFIEFFAIILLGSLLGIFTSLISMI